MARTTGLGGLLLAGVACAMLANGAVPTLSAQASPTASALEPRSLVRAETIRAQVDARYRAVPGRGLAVTEATSTDVVESFALLTSDVLEPRFVPADDGIWYATCPVGATCPYPARRLARPAADLVVRRLALDLAVRTFLQTNADVVAVSLPTPRFTAFVVERDELVREVDVAAVARTISGNPARTLSASLRAIVGGVTRRRVFVFAGLEPTPSGRDVWVGFPRWPIPSA